MKFDGWTSKLSLMPKATNSKGLMSPANSLPTIRRGVPRSSYVESDNPGHRAHLSCRLEPRRMREEVEGRLFDLCAAVQDIIKHHEEQVDAAIEEVASLLNSS